LSADSGKQRRVKYSWHSGNCLPRRLLCFFDAQDCSALKDESIGFGKANRGVSGPISNPSALRGWPDDVINSIYPSFSLDDNNRAFDFVTYLHDSSCEDPVGMTMTFAHELRHFVQWATMPNVRKANERFQDWLRNFDTGFVTISLPLVQKTPVRSAAELVRKGMHDEFNSENAHRTLWEVVERRRRVERGSGALSPADRKNNNEFVELPEFTTILARPISHGEPPTYPPRPQPTRSPAALFLCSLRLLSFRPWKSLKPNEQRTRF
jgi:hypothetical protein